LYEALVSTPHPLSSSQREIWFDQIVHAGIPLYNIGGVTEIPGPIDPALFRAAVERVVRENDAMRVILHPGDPLPVQEMLVDPPVPFRFLDLSRDPNPDAASREWMQREFARPFALYGHLLFDYTLIKLGDRKYRWLIKQHHLIGDGWSISLIVRRMAEAYSDLASLDLARDTAGRAATTAQPSYLDFVQDDAEYLESPKFDTDRAYWAAKYADASEPMIERDAGPAHRVPAGPVPSGVGQMWLERRFYDELAQMATDLGATIFHVMVGALYSYFANVNGRADVVIGLPILNRATRSMKDTVGLFAGVSPARFRLGDDLTFAELIAAIGRELRQDYRRQRFPLSEIRRLCDAGQPGHQRLFDVTLSFERHDYEAAFAGVPSESYALLNGFEQNALSVFVRDQYATQDVRVDFSHNLSAFSEREIAVLMPRMRALLEAVARNPRTRVCDLPTLTAPERARILTSADAVDCPFPVSTTIVDAFDAQVARHPGREAVTCDGRRVTYRELDDHATHIAGAIHAVAAIAPDDRVALLMDRSERLAAGVLGILKSGAAYVPIDPDYPAERIAFICADSQVRAIVTEPHLMHLVPEGVAIVQASSQGPRVPRSQGLVPRSQGLVPRSQGLVPRSKGPQSNEDGERLSTLDEPSDPGTFGPSNLAYVIYTSGTSGQPKGVMIEHRHVIRLLFNDRFPFDFDERDTWTLFHSICFDFSVWELFGALLTGGRLVVVPKETTRDPAAFRRLLADEDVTVLNQTPRAFYSLAAEVVGAGARLPRLRHVIFGGEALAPGKLGEWAARHPGTRLTNMYGITETTVHVTIKTLTPEDIQQNTANVGGPLPTLAVYVLNPRLQPVPAGMPGELCVGGVGVARGYLNRPDLTAEKFVDNPYRPGERLYRSGDRARLLESGELEYLGRIDQQVKVRGFRIEPAEVEHALLRHPAVREAIVRTRRSADDTVLCAWFTTREDAPAPVADDLRVFMSALVPEHMVPAWFVPLASVPLTANGKVDTAALPAPGDGAAHPGQRYEAPADDMERAIAEIWTGVLDVERVGARDNFFHVGGDSIRAIRAVGRMNARFGEYFGVADLYRAPTVAALAGHLRQSPGPREDGRARHLARMADLRAQLTASGRVQPGEIDDVFPMSDIEKGLVYYYLRHLGQGVYHDQFVYEIPYGAFEPLRFERALESVVRAHPALRSSFDMESADEFVQVVWRAPVVDFAHMDLRDMAADARDAAVALHLRDDKARPFDTARAPLWRMRSFQLDGDRVAFVFSFHHAILDGWSFVNFNVDLHRAYANGQEPAPPASTYRDAVLDELVERERPEHAEFWRRDLADYRRLDVADRRADGGTEMRTLRRDLGPDALERLRRIAARQGTSIKNLCFAAYAFAAGLLTADSDVVIGHVTNVRPSDEDGDRILGCFLNTVPVRVRLAANTTWQTHVQRVDARMLEVKPHERLPLARIAEALGETNRDQNPFFDTLFNFMDFHLYDEVNRAEGITRFSYDRTLGVDGSLITNTLLDFEVNVSAGRLVLCPKYNVGAVSDDRVASLCDAFVRALELIDSTPDAIARKADVIPAAERQWLVETLNDTSVPYAKHELVHQLFEDRVEWAPDRVAVVAADETLTYAALNARANQLGWQLRAAGIRGGRAVGVMLDRTPHMIVSVLAVLKAGGAYVPMDPDLPEARVAHILGSLDIDLVIAEPRVRARLAGLDRPVAFIDPRDASTSESADNLPPSVTPRDRAYVIFTSGSTGTPKGVIVQHQPVVNVIQWVNRTFDVTSRDRLLFVTSLGFDLSVYDIFGILAAGGSIRIADRDDIRDPRRLLDILVHEPITFWDSAPAMLQQIAPLLHPGPEGPGNLRLVFLSGDWIPVTLPDAVRRVFTNAEVVSLGGATEATIWSNFFRIGAVDPAWPSIPYGAPIQNAKYYVLDHALDLCPTGIAGDLYIGGECLAAGYDDAALTAARFLPNPFAPGERVYKTGDNARWMADGQMEFLGRSDQQVKIRGFRVEPGEIEHQLLRHAAVKEALVVPFQSRHNQKELAAYLVLAGGRAADATVTSLRAYLAEFLPDYMVPSAFVSMDAFPMSANGKVDRKALPAPDAHGLALGHDRVAPRTEIESAMTRIWEAVLARPSIGVTDNFFDLGGQSLTATQVVSRTRKELGVDLSLRGFFQSPTIAELAAAVSTRQDAGVSRAIAPVAPADSYDVSHAQRRLWILDQFDKDKVTYNLPASFLLRGPVDVAALTNAFRILIARHEMLRTTFHEAAGQPVQVVHDAVDFHIGVTDLRGDIDPQSRARHIALDDAYRPFDLSAAPLLRVQLLRVAGDEHVLLFNMHHIISDGWSLNLLVGELMDAYAGRVGLAPLPIQYKEYAAWQNARLASSEVDEARAYWHERFDRPAAPLELPADFARPATKSFHGDTVRHMLPATLAARLRLACRDADATLFMGIVALVKVLLHRYTGQTDIVVGSPIAGREHADLERQIGFYVNLLPLRDTISGQDSFDDVLRRVKDTTTLAYQHQIYPFDRLVDEIARHRDAGRNPLFDVAVALQHEPAREIRLGETVLQPFIDNYRISRFDLTFTFVEHGDQVELAIEYSTDLFKADTILRMCGHLEQLLAGAIDLPMRAISALDMLTPEERHRVLVAWNETQTAYPRHSTLASLFAEQAAIRPAHPAIVTEDRVISYGELNATANRIARVLQALGTERGDVVAILGDRSPEMVAAVMGVLKTGAAYLPLTSDIPHARVRYMLQDANVRVVLAEPHLAVAVDGVARVPFDDARIMSAEAGDVRVAGSADDLAYVIYTSGSTGEPKGALVRQRSVSRVVRDTNYLQITPDDCLLQLSSFAFDGSVFDIFGALLNGATLAMARKEEVLSPFVLGDLVRRHRVSVMFITTALFNALTDADLSCLAGVRRVLFGGERVSVKHVRCALAALGPGRLVHVYGPTETTVFATAFAVNDVPDHAETIPIGAPISNTRAYVLSRDGAVAPIGVAGTLHIGGDAIALGYLNQAALTSVRFGADPFHPGETMYDSGDLVRWRADGALEFLGRADDQVKIRGFRIEPGEIAGALLTHPAVRETIVVPYSPAGDGGDLRLVAYVVAGTAMDAATLRAHLSSTLPEHMIPSDFMFIERMPLNANGKIDTRALPPPIRGADARTQPYVAPRTTLEEDLARIWEEALGITPVGIHDNFFALGGHSLKATQIVSTIYQRLQVKLELKTMFTDPTIADIASHIEAVDWIAKPARRGPSSGPLPPDLILQ
jgi:amino acid adenylation domain-containing protein